MLQSVESIEIINYQLFLCQEFFFQTREKWENNVFKPLSFPFVVLTSGNFR